MEKRNNKNTLARSEEVVGTTIQVPIEIWRRMRNLATDRRVTAQSLWLRAMGEFLEREEFIPETSPERSSESDQPAA